MPVRSSLFAPTLLALSTLLLGACDGNPLQAAARQTVCCCDHCPAAAAPSGKTAKSGVVTRAVATGGETRAYRTRSRGGRADSTGGGYGSYGPSGGSYSGGYSSGYGGRYGVRGGVSVSVTERESSSSRYSYSESSSAYGASASGYAYSGGAYAGGAGGTSESPHHPGYRAAQTDRDGYLTWPGKVED